MTDKLKCPFCGEELEKEMAGDIETGWLVCCTKNCPIIDQNLFPDVWELLTTGKRAQDSLKEISRLNQYIREELAHQIPEEASKADNSIYTITFEIAKECRKGLHNKIEEKSDGR